MNASRSSSKNQSTTNENVAELSELNLSFDESVLQLIDEPFESKVNSESKLRTDFKYNGFDSSLGGTFIYPTNYPVRQYQLHISRVSFFKNTLVCLPTGLGKTFIASVVMYNIFRWYPKGKIIFMAPTRPLVAQQIQACYQIMGFPKEETIELTGRQNKKIRASAWTSKRVFYCTPQVVWSDMNDNEIDFPFNDIKLIVVDEAHKAKGKYAYTEVVQSIWSRNKLFRVLALSATPGRSMKDVCEVIQNLLISNVEVRKESSIDVAPYVFKKNIKTIVVQLDDQLNQTKKRLYDLVEPYVESLVKNQVIAGHIGNLTKAWLLFDRNKFRESTVTNRHPEQTKINGDFSVCISMYHAIELLERHGMRVFLNYFNDTNSDSSAEEKFFVMKDSKIKNFINEIRSNSGITPFTDQDMSFHGNTSDITDLEPVNYGHPKFEILQKCLLDHFQENSDTKTDTKALVFCEYRESVFLINRMLLSNRPLIKPKVFVGQGSSHNRTITQKEQIVIMNDFRSGKCNTLIATCVAEEGIDVGEVDFIVCFDVNNKNPIRFVQRIGRTGRKRQGKVTMLVTEGKEQQMLKDILVTKDGINQRIGKSNEVKNMLYKDCPRLVPPEFNPQCVETFIDIARQEATTEKTNAKKGTKDSKKKKKSPKPNIQRKVGGVRHFFGKPVEIEIDKEIDENFDLTSYRVYNTSTDQRGNLIEDQLEIDPPDLTLNYNNDDVEQLVSRYHDGEVPLEIKFEKVYRQYYNTKKSRAKWNGFSEKLSKTDYNNQHVPDILKKFLISSSDESNENRVFKTNRDSWRSISDERRLEIFKFMSLFTQQCKLNASKSKSSLCNSANLKNDSETELHLNSLIDSQVSFSMQIETHQSKYASQMKVPVEKLVSPMTPLQQIASSTPHEIPNLKRIPAAPVHSPIVNTPLENKRKQTHKQNRRRDVEGPNWYLKFLGLNTVYDLFSDDGDSSLENTSHATTNTSDEQQAKLCDTLNKSVCGNENLVEEESQYTVSRILKICQDAERVDVNECEVKPSGSTTRRRRLYIGSIDDLFREEDDDDDNDDVIINTQAVDVTLSESDETVNYDVEDAMANQKDVHHSISLFKDTSGGEPSNKSTNTLAKSVTGAKSDELFSTFNESLANISKPDAGNVNGRIPPDTRSQQEESMKTTPKKQNNSNLYVYHSRSPSVLIKSSSILSTRFDNNQADRSFCNTSRISSNRTNKSPTSLSSKLSVLNSQLGFSKYTDDEILDELKENFSSPFFTFWSPDANRNQNKPLQPEADSNCETEYSGDEDFTTCQTSLSRKKASGVKSQGKKKRKARSKFNFIDDEAGVSGDESSDDDDFINTQSQHFNVTEQYEEDDPSVDMQAKYLQSIRSPVGRRRHFRIPSIGYRNPTATQNLFSQFVAPDQSRYEEDSFVVGSDEDEEEEEGNESDCTVISNDVSTDFDEITIAPIKSNKRKSDETKQSRAKKRLRIIEMSSDSD
ncbi:uncharacterized protein LOC129575739 isoform X2 [Sitodiplosis mosellana]|uniref:uncharacterized protein LOC129575739 isoform X2 n=1 Tax=Sitodiplosis mosellana TaxID=263140 RepID=UPI002443B6C3|nr:uncharacterized protein LOC129575739 isoform X2 [Sitodiplosis mosellana]